MKNLQDFIGPAKTPAMKVRVIDKNGSEIKTFDAPVGFQLERYVDALYPENEFMTIDTDKEVTISVLEKDEITEIYQGVYQ